MSEESTSRFVRAQPDFFERADDLRAVLDGNFADPRSARPERFVWDYWHVPGQYTHLRTPAWEYFPDELYTAFHERLVAWGREHLGCWDVSPPWLSAYVEGCGQELHSDVPHGPWAFVYALAPTERSEFRGGETMILRPETLDYWPSFPRTTEGQDREEGSFVQRIAPQFDTLLVFDPRFPHGVSRVSGTHDPSAGRVVIHGWFTEPRPFAEGALETEQVTAVLDDVLPSLIARVEGADDLHGMLSVRLEVAADGTVASITLLTQTLMCLSSPGEIEEQTVATLGSGLRELRFPAAAAETQVTLPLLFS